MGFVGVRKGIFGLEVGAVENATCEQEIGGLKG
jgi:hypothetical protein